ncbi:MAG TPA: hypothetical protein VMG59_12745 [Phycisphaerae bacterium]|nr:hypothetical protein [Phycisphaerae bacterium]
MTTDLSPTTDSQTQAACTSWLRRTPWPLFLFVVVLVLLAADRYRYLAHFGFVYTDGDQTTFWYQADDIAHGIFREPCIYGQSYNVPIEAWLAAPLLMVHVPAYIALPLASAIQGLIPFLVLALFAYRRGYRWAASIILLIPLALPIEYAVVSSLPRGFTNGLAIATPAIVCWLFYQSGKSFFFGSFFAVLGLTVNPNCSIILLAVGLFALLTHWRSLKFYIFSLLGALAAAPAPLLIDLFYRYHPECNLYHPKAPFVFNWQMLNDSVFLTGRPSFMLNQQELDLFFANFIPIVQKGWLILIVLPALALLLLFVRGVKAAVAIFMASVFAIFCLGILRVHMASYDVFYPGSRMYLALPVLFAVGLLWLDMGLEENSKKKFRPGPAVIRGLLMVCLAGCAICRDAALLDPPSPFVTNAFLPPVQSVEQLKTDCSAIAAACKKYDVSLVLVGDRSYSSFNEAAPVLTHHVFGTLYPPFERRGFRIAQERTRRHTRVLLYMPTNVQIFEIEWRFPKTIVISQTPQLLLIELPAPGMAGLDIAEAIGLPYYPTF